MTGKLYGKKKLTTNIVLDEKLTIFPLISETSQGCPLLLLLLNIILGVLAKCIKKGNNTYTNRKKENYLQGLPWWRSGSESACLCRGRGFEPWSRKIPHATEQLGP